MEPNIIGGVTKITAGAGIHFAIPSRLKSPRVGHHLFVPTKGQANARVIAINGQMVIMQGRKHQVHKECQGQKGRYNNRQFTIHVYLSPPLPLKASSACLNNTLKVVKEP